MLRYGVVLDNVSHLCVEHPLGHSRFRAPSHGRFDICRAVDTALDDTALDGLCSFQQGVCVFFEFLSQSSRLQICPVPARLDDVGSWFEFGGRELRPVLQRRTSSTNYSTALVWLG